MAKEYLGEVVGIQKYPDDSGYIIHLYSRERNGTFSLIFLDEKDSMNWNPTTARNSQQLSLYKRDKRVVSEGSVPKKNYVFIGSPELMKKAMKYLGICPLFLID